MTGSLVSKNKTNERTTQKQQTGNFNKHRHTRSIGNDQSSDLLHLTWGNGNHTHPPKKYIERMGSQPTKVLAQGYPPKSRTHNIDVGNSCCHGINYRPIYRATYRYKSF